MTMRSTRFLLLMLLAVACVLAMSTRAFAAAEPVNENANADVVSPAVSNHAEQKSSDTAQESSQEVTESVQQSSTRTIRQDGVTTTTSSASSSGGSGSEGGGKTSSKNTIGGTDSSDISTFKPDMVPTTALASQVQRYYNNASMYAYDTTWSTTGSDTTLSSSTIPVTLESSSTQGSLPIPAHTPGDAATLAFGVLAAVFQMGQQAIVSPASSIVPAIAAVVVSRFAIPLAAVSTTLAGLFLLSLLLQSWRKSGFVHAARSDVDGMGTMFLLQKMSL